MSTTTANSITNTADVATWIVFKPRASSLVVQAMSMATENCTLLATENRTLLGRTSRAERTFSR